MTPAPVQDQPRAIGAASVRTKLVGCDTRLENLRQSGSLKTLFPTRTETLEVLAINTAGGVTGGDRFDLAVHAGPGTHVTCTTQAAERFYRSQPGQVGRLDTNLQLDDRAQLHWLPQETIVFNEANVRRRLSVTLRETSELLLVEPMLFGRLAMDETVSNATVIDSISINLSGTPIYSDRFALSGNIAQQMDRPAVGNGARAMANIIFVGKRAPALLADVRTRLPDRAGASLIGYGLLCIRVLAADGFELRGRIIPILTLLAQRDLPTSWRL